MLKEGELIGAFNLFRQEVRPFTEKQIELVTNFAAQAVIAIENTRLLNELRQRTDDLTESLEQQTATSEVLKVISSSPGELEPVFQAMLENATRICEAKFGFLWLLDGEKFPAVALHGVPPAWRNAAARSDHRPPVRTIPFGRALRSKAIVHVARSDDGPSLYRKISAAWSNSSNLAAPARCWWCRCSRTTSWSVPSHLPPGGSARSPTSRSSWCRTSRRRPSSPSRTRGCSTS